MSRLNYLILNGGEILPHAMSVNLPKDTLENSVSLVVGWDSPMGTYFHQTYQGVDIWEQDPLTWTGYNAQEMKTVDELIIKIKVDLPSFEMPADMRMQLEMMHSDEGTSFSNKNPGLQDMLKELFPEQDWPE